VTAPGRRSSLPFLGPLLLVAGAAAATLAHGPLSAARARMKAAAQPLYIPSGKAARVLSFGHPSTLADAMYLWAIQHFSEPPKNRRERRDWLVRVYGTMTDLDPKFRDAYWLGFLSLDVEAKSPDDAFALAEKALDHDPQNRWIAIEAAMTARRAKRTELAKHFFSRACEQGDPVTCRFLARTSEHDWAQEEMAEWESIYDVQQDEYGRKIVQAHLDDLTRLVETRLLTALVGCYRRERGLLPARLEMLVEAKYIENLPNDPEGKPYELDPRTGLVSSPVRFRFDPPSNARLGVDLSSLGRCAQSAAP